METNNDAVIDAIKGRADDYVILLPMGERTKDVDVSIHRAFVAGAKSEREELLRWNAANMYLPEEGIPVLAKVEGRQGEFGCCWNGWKVLLVLNYRWCEAIPVDNGVMVDFRPIDYNVLSWRYIHEK